MYDSTPIYPCFPAITDFTLRSVFIGGALSSDFSAPLLHGVVRQTSLMDGLVVSALKSGSSRFTGKGGFDLQEEVAVVPVAIGHPLDHFDPIIHPFQHTGVEPMCGAGDDILQKGPQLFSELHQRLDSAA